MVVKILCQLEASNRHSIFSQRTSEFWNKLDKIFLDTTSVGWDFPTDVVSHSR